MSILTAEELVYTQSEDGLLLEGAVIRPANKPARPISIVWTHGLTGRFYSPGTVRIGRQLAAHGYVFVTGNNRGHDFGAVYRDIAGERLIRGGGWEQFDESPRDVAAWVDFAASASSGRVVLLGHSLGALKVCYYQAQRQDPRLIGLIAASPPTRAGQIDPPVRARAERMLAEGRGDDLLPWDTTRAGAGTLSARAYVNRLKANLDVYGFHSPDPAVARIRCPLLAFYGTDEEWVGTAADLETIRRNARSVARIDTRTFEGADHSYTGHEAEVASAIADWIAELR